MAAEVKKPLTREDIPVGFRFYKQMIIDISTLEGMDPVLIAAICWQESSFRADAFRFEPDFWNRYLKINPLYKMLNPRRVSSSYGLMQVMYSRVLEDKLTDNDALPPEHLFVPEMGLRTGVQFFKELLAWAKGRIAAIPPEQLRGLPPLQPERVALAAYNGGRGGNDPSKNWPLRNGVYAREVLEKFAILRKEFA